MNGLSLRQHWGDVVCRVKFQGVDVLCVEVTGDGVLDGMTVCDRRWAVGVFTRVRTNY